MADEVPDTKEEVFHQLLDEYIESEEYLQQEHSQVSPEELKAKRQEWRRRYRNAE